MKRDENAGGTVGDADESGEKASDFDSGNNKAMDSMDMTAASFLIWWNGDIHAGCGYYEKLVQYPKSYESD